MRDEAEFMRYKSIADKHGYVMVSVKLTAPTEVLLERFRERVTRAAAAGSNISVTDEALYRKNLEWEPYVPEDTETFDSSIMSADEIADRVVKTITEANN
jgi:hypothetical protein